MMLDEGVQHAWDQAASMLAWILSVFVFKIRLIVEIWNGFCPVLQLFKSIIFEALKSLALLWFAAPVLQYMALWVVRLVVFTLEPMMDLIVTLFETLAYMFSETIEGTSATFTGGGRRLFSLDEMATKLSSYRKQHIVASSMGFSMEEYVDYCIKTPFDTEKCAAYQEDPNSHLLYRRNSRHNRNLFQTEEALDDTLDDAYDMGDDFTETITPYGDWLLDASVCVLTIIIRLFQALVVAFAPLLVSFIFKVLPLIIPLVKFLVELFGSLWNVVTSDPMMRIVDLALQALPIMWEVLGIILCTLIIYLMPVFCYLLFGCVVVLGFILEYMIAPMACFSGFVFAGCTENFFFPDQSGGCLRCGNYNTACGCRKEYSPQGACAGTCVGPDPTNPSNTVTVDSDCVGNGGGCVGAAQAPESRTKDVQSRPPSDPASWLQNNDGVSKINEMRNSNTLEPHHTTIDSMHMNFGLKSSMSDHVFDMSEGANETTTSKPAGISWDQWIADNQIVQSSTNINFNGFFSPITSVMYVSASPTMYAELILSPLLNDTYAFWMGALPTQFHQGADWECLHGIDEVQCASQSVMTSLSEHTHIDLSKIAKHESHSTTRAGWQPVTWQTNPSVESLPSKHWDLKCSIPTGLSGLSNSVANPCPWFRVALERPYRVAELVAIWGGDSQSGLQAPNKYQVWFHPFTHENTHISGHMQYHQFESMDCQQNPRVDNITLVDGKTPYVTSVVTLYLQSACYSSMEQYGSLFDLRSLWLYTNSTSFGDTDLHPLGVDSLKPLAELNPWMNSEEYRDIGANVYGDARKAAKDEFLKNKVELAVSQNLFLSGTGEILLASRMGCSSGMQTWDPCASKRPSSMMNNENRYSTMWLHEHTSANPIEDAYFGFMLSMHSIADNGLLDPSLPAVETRPHIVTLDLAHTSNVDPTKVLLCYDSTGNAVAKTPPWENGLDMNNPPRTRSDDDWPWLSYARYDAYTPGATQDANHIGDICITADNTLSANPVCPGFPECDFRDREFGENLEAELFKYTGHHGHHNRTIPFLSDSYKQQFGSPPTRESSISFVFPSPLVPLSFGDIDHIDKFSVWFAPGSMHNTRATTWETARVETGMSHIGTHTNSWMLEVNTNYGDNNPNGGGFGKTAPLTSRSTTVNSQCRMWDIEPANTNLCGIANYADPFVTADASNIKSWIGIKATRVIGTATTLVSGGSRRLLSDPDETTQNKLHSKQMNHLRYLSEIEGNSTEKKPTAPYTPELHGLLNEGEIDSAPNVDIRDIMRIYGHHATSSKLPSGVDALKDHFFDKAPQNPRHHPFHEDLRLMPDPTTETTFDCDAIEDGGDTLCVPIRMKEIDYSPTETLDDTSDTPDLQSKSDQEVKSKESDRQSKEDKLVTDTFKRLSSEIDQIVSKSLTEVGLNEKDVDAMGVSMEDELMKSLYTRNKVATKAELTEAIKESSSRQLLGSGNPFDALDPRNIWNAVKDKVEQAIEAALDALEKGLANAIGCKAVCTGRTGAWANCDGDELGPCFKHFPEFILRSILGGCYGADKSIQDCLEDTFLKPIIDLLKMIIKYFLKLIDLAASVIKDALGYGDIIQLVACMACKMTTIAAGALADFASNFELGHCMTIANGGAQQCDAWGIDTGAFGFAIFETMFPLAKVLFGVVQTIPSMIEVLVEITVEIFKDHIVESEIWSVAFDLVLWLVTLDDILPVFETVAVAFKDAVTSTCPAASDGDLDKGLYDAASVDIDLPEGLSGAASGIGGGTGNWAGDSLGGIDIEIDLDYPLSHNTWDQYCFTGEGGEYTKTDTSAKCNPPSLAYMDTGVNHSVNNAGGIVGAKTNISNTAIDVDESLTFQMGSCGCSVTRQVCQDGVGVGRCTKQQGSYLKRSIKVKEEIRAMLESQANGSMVLNISDITTWPVCPGVQPRMINISISGEMKRIPVNQTGKPKCFIYSMEKNVRSRYNSMWPFVGFSLRNGQHSMEPEVHRRRTVVGGVNGQDYTSHFPSSYPNLDDIKRMREERENGGGGTASRRLFNMDDPVHASVAMGVHDFFPEHTKEQVKNAQTAISLLIGQGNETVASIQYKLILRDMKKIVNLKREVISNFTDTTNESWERAMTHGRRLFGVAEDASKIGCGWADPSQGPPNTYPCCKGVWCCVPPPFGDDFYVQKEWFAWSDSYHYDLLCPYMFSFGDGMLFTFRAVSKLVSDGATDDITIWPFNLIFGKVWTIFQFPNDEWPDNTGNMIRCYFLNVGTLVTVIFAFIILAFLIGDLANFALLNVAILSCLFKPSLSDIDDARWRRYVEHCEAAQKQTAEPIRQQSVRSTGTFEHL
jgi:hypothetical protein